MIKFYKKYLTFNFDIMNPLNEGGNVEINENQKKGSMLGKLKAGLLSLSLLSGGANAESKISEKIQTERDNLKDVVVGVLETKKQSGKEEINLKTGISLEMLNNQIKSVNIDIDNSAKVASSEKVGPGAVIDDSIDENQTVFNGMNPEEIRLFHEKYPDFVTKFIRVEKAETPLVGVVPTEFKDFLISKSELVLPAEVTKENLEKTMMDVLQNRGSNPDLETRYKDRIKEISENKEVLDKVLSSLNKIIENYKNIENKEINPYVIERQFTGVISLLLNDENYIEKSVNQVMALAQDIYTFLVSVDYYTDKGESYSKNSYKGYLNGNEGYTFTEIDEKVISRLKEFGVDFSFDGVITFNEEYRKYKEVYASMKNTFSEMETKASSAKNEKLKARMMKMYDKYTSEFEALSINSKAEVLKMFEKADSGKVNDISALMKIVDLVVILDQIDADGVEYNEKQFDRTFKYLARTSVKEPMVEVMNSRLKANKEEIKKKDAILEANKEEIKKKDAILEANKEEIRNLDKKIKMFDSLLSMK